MIRKLLSIFFLSQMFLIGWAQQTINDLGVNAVYDQAMDYYKKEKYNTAQKLFQQVYEAEKVNDSEVKSFSQYYIAQCAVRLFNADAEFLTMEFISNNPNHPLINEAYFNLGGYFYAQKNWTEGIKNYNKTDWRNLSEEEQAEFFFKKGYCYFEKGDMETAKLNFYEIKDKRTKYTAPALYYYSHIHYQDKNYQTALEGFLKLSEDKTFGPIVPYYVVQIYYMQGKYEEVVNYTPGIINNVTETRLDEVSRITAESFFKLERYSEAKTYYQKYLSASNNPAPEAIYQLGYSCYKTNEIDTAIVNFAKISHLESALGQNASYYLASCYIKKGDKENARKAFASASRTDFDPVIKQDAMFNYALVTFEIGGDPFTDAIKSFEDYIVAYPAAKNIDEANRMLVQSYLAARNYKSALASIEKIENKNDELKEAYQRIAYGRGVELFNNAQFVQSAEMFKIALKYRGFNQQREAGAIYWLGESLYRQGKYDEALQQYKLFKDAPAAHTLEEFVMADYNMGYAYLKKDSYSAASQSFRQFTSNYKGDRNIQSDACLRLGDCYFMQGNYSQAVDFYQKALDNGTEAKDYALLQKGLCLGLGKNELQKIATMKQVAENYPNSVYADNAYYEMAQEYVKLQDSQQAIEALTTMYSKFPESELAGKALVQLGLLNYNADNNEQAIKYYKLAVSNYPGTDEARDALFGLKNIYIDLGKIEEYSAFVDGLGGNVPRLSINEKDSLSYFAAEKIYMSANCPEAKKAFGTYIANYPSGNYLINAHFFKGDCHYQAKEFDDALKMFDFVVQQPKNKFTEQALLGCARIAVSAKNSEKSVEYYEKLAKVSSSELNKKEALLGLMRTYYANNNFNKSLEKANDVLSLSNISEENVKEAKFIKARSLQETGNELMALDVFREISKEVSSPQGAESKFRVSEILYNQKKYDEAEKEILEFSSMNTSHDYWIARSFILWADIFSERKNYFQSIETLQSLIDYYENKTDGIIEMAKARKVEVQAKSAKASEGAQQENMEVNIESNK